MSRAPSASRVGGRDKSKYGRRGVHVGTRAQQRRKREGYYRRLVEAIYSGGRRLWSAWQRIFPPSTFIGAITRMGWVTVALGALSLSAGIAGGYLEIAIFGVFSLAVLFYALIWAFGQTTYEVELSLAKDRVVAGESAVGSLVVRNNGNRTVSGSIIELPVGNALAAFRVPRLLAGGEYSETFMIPTRRRSVMEVGPATSVRGDPLGVVRRSQVWTRSLTLWVHPKTVRLEPEITGFLRDIEGMTTQDLSSSDVSFHTLREYSPGDDRRSVHWRTTARVGKLMVRQFEETRRAQQLIVLSQDRHDYADSSEFETAVSCAASLALEAIRSGKQVTLVPHEGELAANTGLKMLDSLAGIEMGYPDLGIQEATRRAILSNPQSSVVTVLGGSRVENPALLTIRASVPPEVNGFVVLVSDERLVSRRHVDTLPILGLSRIEDLPRALGRLR